MRVASRSEGTALTERRLYGHVNATGYFPLQLLAVQQVPPWQLPPKLSAQSTAQVLPPQVVLPAHALLPVQRIVLLSVPELVMPAPQELDPAQSTSQRAPWQVTGAPQDPRPLHATLQVLPWQVIGSEHEKSPLH